MYLEGPVGRNMVFCALVHVGGGGVLSEHCEIDGSAWELKKDVCFSRPPFLGYQ